jgi:hypothetical protein
MHLGGKTAGPRYIVCLVDVVTSKVLDTKYNYYQSLPG